MMNLSAVNGFQSRRAAHAGRALFPLSALAAACTAWVALAVPVSGLAAETRVDGKIELRTDTKAATKADKPVAATGGREGAGDAAKSGREINFQQAFVTVNGSAQSVAMAELLLREQLLRGAPDSAELRNGVREALVSNALMEQEAKKAGLDKNPLLQAQMEMARQRVLINAWQQKWLGDEKIGDAEVSAEYNRQVQRMAGNDVRLRQVLVSDEVSAKLLLEKARSGSKLDELAKEYSREPSAKTTGGLSDWINAADLLPPLAEAVKNAAKGQLLVAPVQTPNGWHVVQVEDLRVFKPLPMDEVKPQILALLQQRALQGRLKNLREQAQVK